MEKRQRVRAGHSEAATEFEYPARCLREVIANALCHRDYEDRERRVHIRLFKARTERTSDGDRIEISSPGRWAADPNVLTEEPLPIGRLAGESVAPNARLAHGIAVIDLAEGEGSGLEVAIQDCRAVGAPDPTVRVRDGMIVVTVFPRSDWLPSEEEPAPLSYSEFVESGYLGELAQLFGSPSRANMLLSRVGFPRREVPAFHSPEVFWSSVAKQIDMGAIELDLTGFLSEVADLYPANRLFGKLQRAGGRREGPEASSSAGRPRGGEEVPSEEEGSTSPSEEQSEIRTIMKLVVEGPDQQRFELSNVPESVSFGDIASAIMEEYEDRWPSDPKERRYLVDHVGDDGAVRRLAPGARLDEAGVKDGDTLEVYPESIAGCFPADTPVLVPDGERPIEDLEPGDRVRSRRDTDGSRGSALITEVRREVVSSYLVINGELHISPSQVLLANDDWIPARELRVGDRLFAPDGSAVPVMRIELREEGLEVFGLALDSPEETFFAGGIQVHNLRGGPAGQYLAKNPRARDRIGELLDSILALTDEAGRILRVRELTDR